MQHDDNKTNHYQEVTIIVTILTVTIIITRIINSIVTNDNSIHEK